MNVNAIDGFNEPLEDLRAALAASGVVGTWNWDVVRHVATYDQGAAKLLAQDPDLAGKPLHGQAAIVGMHPDDVDWMRETTDRLIRNGGLILAEYRVVSLAGEVRWLLSRGRVYQDALGRPVRCRGILIDITESRDDAQGYVTQTSLRSEGPLERAAILCLDARSALGDGTSSKLRLLMDLLLLELGREIGSRMDA
ncbi:PAS domain-containing protein [Methylobacterium trifolii]